MRKKEEKDLKESKKSEKRLRNFNECSVGPRVLRLEPKNVDPGSEVKSDLQTRVVDQRSSLVGTEALRERERSVRLSFHKKLNITYILSDFTDMSQAFKARELEIGSFCKQRSSLTLVSGNCDFVRRY